MVPSNVQLLNSNFSQSFGYKDVKDHEEEGGGHVGEAGGNERVGILDKFLFYVVWQAPMSV